MKEPRFLSKCPSCGNIDTLTEEETKRDVHCQRCYHHYDYKLSDIKRRITKDSNGISNYINVTIEEMDWCVEQAEKVDDLISIALWSIRRLPTNSLKQYALQDLGKVVGENHKYSEFIGDCIAEIMTDNEQFAKTVDTNYEGVN